MTFDLKPGYLCTIVQDSYGFLARSDLIDQLVIVIAVVEKPSRFQTYLALVCSTGVVCHFFREMLDDTKFTFANLRLNVNEHQSLLPMYVLNKTLF